MDGIKYGVFLQSRLDALNTNANQLQVKAGITAVQIRNILKAKSQRAKDGVAKPRKETVIAIAQALGDPVDDHLIAAGFIVASVLETTDPYIQKISSFLNDLPATYKEDVVALTEAIWKRHGVIDFRKGGKNSGMSEEERHKYFQTQDGLEEAATNEAADESSTPSDDNNKPPGRKRKT